VVKIAFEYKSAYQNVMDLIQEGNIGLMKAISLYNPDKGAKLSYYSSWWIRSYILKFLIDNFRLVKIGTTQAQKKLFYNLIHEKEKLEMQGKLALPLLLSENLAVKEKEIVEMSSRLSGGSEVSLDQPINDPGNDKAPSVLSTYEDNSQRPDLLVEEKEYKQYLKQKLSEFSTSLNDKEKMILKERLLSEAPVTLQNIADNFGISKERARQLENRIMGKLKDFLKE
jgi:RNA polymerase sigma-32 factor